MQKYFYEAFENMERLGPGSNESTLNAIKLYNEKKKKINILDVGCGIGTQTFILAEYFKESNIIAIDNNKTYIEQLNKKAEEKGISNRVKGIEMSMLEMTFENESFDLIWAEGSIYIIGFKEGIKQWKRFLKDDGYIICSEISWIKEDISIESYTYWNNAYKEIDNINNKIKQIEDAGYINKGYFISPVTDWTDNYYNYIEKNLSKMKLKYSNKQALDVIKILEEEIGIYKKYKDEYSYVFYSMKKI